MQINFSDAEEKFIKSQVENGNYINEGEMIKDAICRLRQEIEKKQQFLEAVLLGDEQIERGEAVPYTKELLDEITERAVLRASKGEKPSSDVTP